MSGAKDRDLPAYQYEAEQRGESRLSGTLHFVAAERAPLHAAADPWLLPQLTVAFVLYFYIESALLVVGLLALWHLVENGVYAYAVSSAALGEAVQRCWHRKSTVLTDPLASACGVLCAAVASALTNRVPFERHATLAVHTVALAMLLLALLLAGFRRLYVLCPLLQGGALAVVHYSNTLDDDTANAGTTALVALSLLYFHAAFLAPVRGHFAYNLAFASLYYLLLVSVHHGIGLSGA